MFPLRNGPFQESSYRLRVRVSDGTWAVQTGAAINVLDVNDNAPSFGKSAYLFVVNESQVSPTEEDTTKGLQERFVGGTSTDKSLWSEETNGLANKNRYDIVEEEPQLHWEIELQTLEVVKF